MSATFIVKVAWPADTPRCLIAGCAYTQTWAPACCFVGAPDA